MEHEEWKHIHIPEYSNYLVSSFGNIKNENQQNMTQYLNKDGYYYVRLSFNGKRKVFVCHRLVALLFINNIDNKPIVDHIDRNIKNNYVSNLRWASYQENQRNRIKKPNCSSIYKGVVYHKRDNKWQANIFINKSIHLGYFNNEIDAAKEYNNYIINNKLDSFYILNNC